MQEDKVFEINAFEKLIDDVLNLRAKLETEVYELDSAVNVAREYIKNKDLDFDRYLDILKEKCSKIKKIVQSADYEEV